MGYWKLEIEWWRKKGNAAYKKCIRAKKLLLGDWVFDTGSIKYAAGHATTDTKMQRALKASSNFSTLVVLLLSLALNSKLTVLDRIHCYLPAKFPLLLHGRATWKLIVTVHGKSRVWLNTCLCCIIGKLWQDTASNQCSVSVSVDVYWFGCENGSG